MLIFVYFCLLLVGVDNILFHSGDKMNADKLMVVGVEEIDNLPKKVCNYIHISCCGLHFDYLYSSSMLFRSKKQLND